MWMNLESPRRAFIKEIIPRIFSSSGSLFGGANPFSIAFPENFKPSQAVKHLTTAGPFLCSLTLSALSRRR